MRKTKTKLINGKREKKEKIINLGEMWNCVEDRVSQGHFGRVIRKVIFQNVYADRTAVLSEKPIAQSTLPFLKVSSDMFICTIVTQPSKRE